MYTYPVGTFLFSLIAAFISFEANAAVSYSDAPPNRGSVVVRWLGAKGELKPAGTIEQMQWSWARRDFKDAVESPMLKISLRAGLSANTTILSAAGDGAWLAEPYRPGGPLVLHVASARATLSLELKNADGSRAQRTLIVHLTVKRPYFIAHQECRRHQISALMTHTEAQHLYVGMKCIERGESIDIYFFRSLDSRWNHSPGFVQFDPANKYQAFRFAFHKSVRGSPGERRLFRVGTVDDLKRQTDYVIIQTGE